LTPYGKAKLLDFGLPQRVPANLSLRGVSGLVNLAKAGVPWDSLFYLSPEQTRFEDLDGRSDLFSFAALIYFAATGEQPFDGPDPASIIHRIQNQYPQNPSHHKAHLQGEFDEIVLRALAKDRTNRLSAAPELGKVLGSLKSNYLPESRTGLPEEVEQEIETPEPPASKKQNVALIAFITLIVMIAGAALYWYQANRNQLFSVAILPIESSVPADASNYLTEAIIEGLSLFRGLRVIQPVTILQFPTPSDPISIGKILNVRYVVVGRMESNLGLRLIDVRSGKDKWSKEFHPDLQNLSSARYEIVSQLASQLNQTLNREQQKFLQSEPTRNIEAWKVYQQARALFYKHTRESLASSIHFYDRALALDSDFWLALSGRSIAAIDLAGLTGEINYFQKGL
jgi:serine/threonine protein kinase